MMNQILISSGTNKYYKMQVIKTKYVCSWWLLLWLLCLLLLWLLLWLGVGVVIVDIVGVVMHVSCVGTCSCCHQLIKLVIPGMFCCVVALLVLSSLYRNKKKWTFFIKYGRIGTEIGNHYIYEKGSEKVCEIINNNSQQA